MEAVLGKLLWIHSSALMFKMSAYFKLRCSNWIWFCIITLCICTDKLFCILEFFFNEKSNMGWKWKQLIGIENNLLNQERVLNPYLSWSWSHSHIISCLVYRYRSCIRNYMSILMVPEQTAKYILGDWGFEPNI